LYNIDGGLVGSNKSYIPPDFRVWSPWCKKYDIMPAPSVYPPANWSHAVRWYDSPSVSIIMAVGPTHLEALTNALDSLDAQTFQDFQVVVIFDVDEDTWAAASQSGVLSYIENTWPGCWFTTTASRFRGVRARDITSRLEADLAETSVLASLPAASEPAGPAVARNIGLAITSSPLVFFLDADDWIIPDALEKMYAAHLDTGKVVFSDHIGVAKIKEEDLDSVHGKVLAYRDKEQEAYVHQEITDYRCELAQRQPVLDGTPPYVICNVSSLIPREDIERVGGFDETIASWEDVLLFWQMAWAGTCFTRIAEPLLVYRYFTGFMRERGLENAQDLLKYIKEISDRTDKIGCGCNDKKPLVQQTEAAGMTSQKTRIRLSRGQYMEVADSELIMIEFRPRQDGDIQRFGGVDFGNGNRVSYGPRRAGDKFLALIVDVEAEESLAAAQGRTPEMVRFVSGQPSLPQEPEPEPPAPEVIPDDYNDEVALWKIGDDDELEQVFDDESIFPERVPGGRAMLVSDLDLGELKNADRYISILIGQKIISVGQLLNYEEKWEGKGGLTRITGIGPKVQKALLVAAAKIL